MDKKVPRKEASEDVTQDKKVPRKEASEDVTRESLIALSYRLPEKDSALGLSPENLKSENRVERANGDEGEKYRSMLISLSYPQSSEIKVQPSVPGDNKG